MSQPVDMSCIITLSQVKLGVMKSPSWRLAVLTWVILGLSCGCQPAASEHVSPEPAAALSAEATAAGGTAAAGQRLPAVSALVIRSQAFKIVAPQITYQIMAGVNFPVMSYMLPQASDYIEILRCDGGLQLVDFAGRSIAELNMHSGDAGSWGMLGGGFWQQALTSEQCVMVGYEYSAHSQFTDTTISSGQWFYLARACVMVQRIAAVDRPIMGTSPCSPFVAQSETFHYTSSHELSDLSHMVELSNTGIALEHSLLRLEAAAVATRDALAGCDEQEAERQIRVRRKQALNTLISSVAAVIADFTLPGGQTYSPASGVWGKAKNLGKRLGSAAYLSGGIQTILSGFTSSVDDFPRSCYEGDRLNRNLTVYVAEVSDLHTKYTKLIEAMPASEGF